MGGIFKKPKVQPAAEVPVAPTVDNSQAKLDEANQEMQARLLRGRTSTVLTGGAGLDNTGVTSKQLLGQ